MDFNSALAAADFGANLFGSISNRDAQKKANEQNLQIALMNLIFQDKMSRTAYQRAAQDLEAAGLNRVLALGGPASTPSGASANMVGPKYDKVSALEVASAKEAIEVQKAQKQLLYDQSAKTKSEVAQLEAALPGVMSNTRMLGYEEQKQKLVKILYDKVGPNAIDALDDFLRATGIDKASTAKGHK